MPLLYPHRQCSAARLSWLYLGVMPWVNPGGDSRVSQALTDWIRAFNSLFMSLAQRGSLCVLLLSSPFYCFLDGHVFWGSCVSPLPDFTLLCCTPKESYSVVLTSSVLLFFQVSPMDPHFSQGVAALIFVGSLVSRLILVAALRHGSPNCRQPFLQPVWGPLEQGICD